MANSIQNNNTNRILIDASHPEETRVVVIRNNEIDEYEFEISAKENLKGNIYLGRITKVEASLQAAFVEYGGKKQGFLPFSEINLSSFNLPLVEMENLKAQQSAYKESLRNRSLHKDKQKSLENSEEEPAKEFTNNLNLDDNYPPLMPFSDDLPNDSLLLEDMEINNQGLISNIEPAYTPNTKTPDIYLTDDLLDEEDLIQKLEVENQTYGSRFGYKIQDVIKNDQMILIQVVKEERGNKGASLTTHLSIPGRYCVLMPNTPFEGGISKKINKISDRQRLKKIIDSLEIPENVNIIMRTACLDKTDQEIIQDYNYINGVWKLIQKQSQLSKAPAMLYQEGILIKRVIRDLYAEDINEIIIDGRKAFEMAKSFAKLIAPDIGKKIFKFNHPKLSLAKYYNIEEDIKNVYTPLVFLKSGGYIVINATEALVAIDINSGKAKGRRNVEETAFKTNLEAVYEISKQLKLRDIGGLIVIDFIDMENPRNRNLIEKKVKEISKDDKAKIQVGQISNFGLLELSRQRIKSSLIDKGFHVCSKCQGIGYIRPLELNALQILRSLQSDAANNKIRANGNNLVIKTPTAEAFYLLNNKRYELTNLENHLRTSIRIECNDNILYPFYKIEEDLRKDESADIMLLLEQEIEDNANQITESNKVVNRKKSSPHQDLIHNNNNNNSSNKKPNTLPKIESAFKPKKVAQKRGWLKKLLDF
ncbi:Ribonuclease E/G [Candidatus Hepatincolaceae symbiont of Richtersius coronifer]